MKTLFSTLILILALFVSEESIIEAKRIRKFNKEHAFQQLNAIWGEVGATPAPVGNLSCDQAIDELLLRIPQFGSVFYALVNGWYLGQWADYTSCLSDATDSQYVLASVVGQYDGPFQFSRGGEGKYTNGFSTKMGLCFPKQCSEADVRFYTEELISGYATGIGWKASGTNEKVLINYHMASNHDLAQTATLSTGTAVMGAILALAFVLVVLGTCIEMTSWGDKDEVKGKADAEALGEASKFRRLAQYDAILLQRKSEGAQRFLPFSFLRNGVQLNIHPRTLRTAISNEEKDGAIRKERRIARYLKVFNGIKGSSMLMMAWGTTYYLSWFSVINNPVELNEMKKTLFFNFVSCTVYTVPTFFFCSGFLQTFSFMQRDQEQNMFTFKNLSTYYFRKIFRYMPLNIIAMLFVLHALPYIGSGPVWNYYDTLVKPCGTYWWTNVLWINNIYPREFNDKCLPWTWFVPAYIQLSMVLPPFVALYKFIESKFFLGIIFLLIMILSLLANFMFTYFSNYGATMIMSEEFYAKVFMTPIYHFTSFFYGIAMSIVYIRFRKERGHVSALRNSISSRLIEMIRHNQAPRYLMYLSAILCIGSSILWQTPYLTTDKNSQYSGRLIQALYATFAYPLYLIGLSMLLLPALAGKAQAFRWFYGSQTWTMLAHQSIGMYYAVPIIAIFYFLGTQHQISVTYYMFVYYFAGNIIFGFGLFIPTAMFIDRPIYAMLNLKRDIKDAERHKDYNLIDYLDNFRPELLEAESQGGELLSESMRSIGQKEAKRIRLLDQQQAAAAQAQQSLKKAKGGRDTQSSGSRPSGYGQSDSRRTAAGSERTTGADSRFTGGADSRFGTTMKGEGRFTKAMGSEKI